MINVLFVCHGNICRSPMAEYLFKEYVKNKNQSNLFHIESRATSYEEEGNPIYPNVKRLLSSLQIDTSKHVARRMSVADYNKFDYILLMDENNLRNIKYICNDKNGKIKLLLDYTNRPNKNISDPWYTRNFDETYNDITAGINAFYQYLVDNHKC